MEVIRNVIEGGRWNAISEGIRVLLVVNLGMFGQSRRFTERLIAMRAPIRFLSCMSPNMVLKVPVLGESFVTMRAHVAFLASVGPRVALQARSIPKHPGAKRTRIGFFPRMNANMFA